VAAKMFIITGLNSTVYLYLQYKTLFRGSCPSCF